MRERQSTAAEGVLLDDYTLGERIIHTTRDNPRRWRRSSGDGVAATEHRKESDRERQHGIEVREIHTKSNWRTTLVRIWASDHGDNGDGEYRVAAATENSDGSSSSGDTRAEDKVWN